MTKSSKEFSIRELADEFDVTTRTLRFYEEKGLLKPKRDNSSRIYSAADRTRLRLILRGKRLGFSLEESSAIILMYDAKAKNSEQLHALISKIQEKRNQLHQQQQDINTLLQDLQQAEENCLNALENALEQKKVEQ